MTQQKGLSVVNERCQPACGFAHTAMSPVIYTHDDDGNLLADGQVSYTSAGENRVNVQWSISMVPSTTKKKPEYEYEYRGRRT